jgi:hypothetical protein
MDMVASAMEVLFFYDSVPASDAVALQPGAKVILEGVIAAVMVIEGAPADSQRAMRDEELRRAAELAAYHKHKKARGSAKVAVDYTERNCVRRRHRDPPGLVWHTNAQTLPIAPRA